MRANLMFCKIKNAPLYLFQLTDVLSVQLQWLRTCVIYVLDKLKTFRHKKSTILKSKALLSSDHIIDNIHIMEIATGK